MNKLLANIWKGAIAMAFVSCALVSCEDNPALQDIKFNLDTKEVTIPAEGGQGSFTLDAPVAWKADTPADWLVADPASGEAGNVTITLKANANETGEQRTAKVTVSSTPSAPLQRSRSSSQRKRLTPLLRTRQPLRHRRQRKYPELQPPLLLGKPAEQPHSSLNPRAEPLLHIR